MKKVEKKICDALDSMPTIKRLYDGTGFVMCPVCHAAMPDDDMRSLLKVILREANPELYRKLFETK